MASETHDTEPPDTEPTAAGPPALAAIEAAVAELGSVLEENDRRAVGAIHALRTTVLEHYQRMQGQLDDHEHRLQRLEARGSEP